MILNYLPQNTHQWGKADHMFEWFGFHQTSKADAKSTKIKDVSENTSTVLGNNSLIKQEENKIEKGSGCGSDGTGATSDIRGPRFESSHQQILYYLYTINSNKQLKIKKKETGNGPFEK